MDETAIDPPASLKRRLLFWARDLGLLVVAFFVLSTVVGRLRAPELDGDAPAFTLQTVEGATVSLADLRGQTVVLNFWATWCGPCRAEIPMLNAFAKSHPEIPVLGLAVDGTAEELRAAKASMGIDYPVLVGTRAVVQQYGASTVPTTVIVNPDGQVKTVHVGLITTPQLEFAVW